MDHPSDFERQWRMSNVVLNADGKKLHASAQVLMIVSTYFQKKFASEWANGDTVEVSGDHNVLHEILKIVHHGKSLSYETEFEKEMNYVAEELGIINWKTIRGEDDNVSNDASVPVSHDNKMIIPPNFDEPWGISNAALQARNANGKMLFVSTEVLQIFSTHFRNLLKSDVKPVKDTVFSVPFDYETLKLLLKIMHFSYKRSDFKEPLVLMNVFEMAVDLGCSRAQYVCQKLMRDRKTTEMLKAAAKLGLGDDMEFDHTRTAIAARLEETLCRVPIGLSYEAAEAGRALFHYIFSMPGDLKHLVTGAEELTEHKLLHSEVVENEGRRILMGVRIMAKIFCDPIAFREYLMEIMRDSAIKVNLWTSIIWMVSQYVEQETVKFSVSQRNAWNELEINVDELIADAVHQDDADDDAFSVVRVTGIPEVPPEELLGELSKYGRILEFQGFRLVDREVATEMVWARYAYKEGARQAMDKITKIAGKQVKVIPQLKSPERNRLQDRNNGSWFLYNFAPKKKIELDGESEGDHDDDDFLNEEDDESTWTPVIEADADSGTITPPPALQYLQGYASSSDDDN